MAFLYRVHMLTATTTEFLVKVMGKFVKADKQCFVIRVPSMNSLSKGGEDNVKIVPHLAVTESQMMASFEAAVKEKVKEMPVIIFVDSKEKDIENWLAEEFGTVPGFQCIKTVKEAGTMRNASFWSSNGVFMISPDFARGLDIKCSKSSHTFVVSMKGKFALSTVRQMIGRSCRSMGVSVGSFYTFGLPMQTDIEQYLLSLEPNYKEGHELLYNLYCHYEKAEAEHKKMLRSFFTSSKWKTTLTNLEYDNEDVFRVLTGEKPFKKAGKGNAPAIKTEEADKPNSN